MFPDVAVTRVAAPPSPGWQSGGYVGGDYGNGGGYGAGGGYGGGYGGEWGQQGADYSQVSYTQRCMNFSLICLKIN